VRLGAPEREPHQGTWLAKGLDSAAPNAKRFEAEPFATTAFK